MKTKPSTSETRLIAALHLARIAMEAAREILAQQLPDRVSAKRIDEYHLAARKLRLLELHLVEDLPGARHLIDVCGEGVEAFAAQRFGAPLCLWPTDGSLICFEATKRIDRTRGLAVTPIAPEAGQ